MGLKLTRRLTVLESDAHFDHQLRWRAEVSVNQFKTG